MLFEAFIANAALPVVNMNVEDSFTNNIDPDEAITATFDVLKEAAVPSNRMLLILYVDSDPIMRVPTGLNNKIECTNQTQNE